MYRNENPHAIYTSGVVGGKTNHVRYICKLGFVRAQLLIVKSKARITFKVKFETSIRHKRIIFLKKL